MMNLTGAQIVLCPSSDLTKPEGLIDIQKLIRNTNNLGLGSDSAATNSNFDLFRDISSLARVIESETTGNLTYTGSKVIEMATYGGAKALGLEDIIGSLEAKKSADIIAINMNDFRDKPIRNLTEQLVNRTEQRQITHVWVGGRLIVEKNELKSSSSSSLARVASFYEDDT